MLQPITDRAGFILASLLIMWLIQFGLAWWQMRRFYDRIAVLRRGGLTAIGLSGDRLRGRSYAVLTVNEMDCVIHAEMFSGWTVFAGLKPIPQVLGYSVDDLCNQTKLATLPVKWRGALSHAAQIIKNARQKAQQTIEQANPAERTIQG